jgi:hypothetical protein
MKQSLIPSLCVCDGASNKIGGVVAGTADTVNSGDHFRLVAQKIGAFWLGGTEVALDVLPETDDVELGETGDLVVREV